MLNLDSIAAFIAIANTGSFTDAARQLAVAKSVVSERLKDLERSLEASAHTFAEGVSGVSVQRGQLSALETNISTAPGP
jgi:hypothetical protein